MNNFASRAYATVTAAREYEAAQQKSEANRVLLDAVDRRARFALFAVDQEAERAALERDLADVERAVKEAQQLTEKYGKAVGRRLRRMAQVELAITLFGAVAGGFLLGVLAHRPTTFRADYFVALATVAPVILVGGFVEVLGAWKGRGGSWAILAFSTPAFIGGGTALGVLSVGRVGPATFFLSTWGTALGAAFLLLNACAHAELLDSRG